MYIVRGRVVVAPSGRGINLIVEAFDVETKDPSMPRRRLGSGETNGKGEFRIDYAVDAADTSGIDLMIVLSPPERLDRTAAPLYMSHEVRQRAAPVEVFLITLTEGDLEKGGGVLVVPPPGDPEPASIASARLLADLRRSLDLARARTEAEQLRVDDARAVTTAFRGEFAPALERSLSSVSENRRRRHVRCPRRSGRRRPQRRRDERSSGMINNSHPTALRSGPASP